MGEHSHIQAIPVDPTVRREWIKYRLKVQGLTMAELARRHKASRQAVASALVKPNPRWEHVIACALGFSAPQLWPERYDPVTLIPIQSVKRETG